VEEGAVAVATLPFGSWSYGSFWIFNDDLDVERTWLHDWILLIVELYNQFPLEIETNDGVINKKLVLQ
jgi:hypothetical protein